MSSVLIPILVAVVPAALAAIFGIITYRQQKHVDRENYVAQKETDRKVELRNRRMKEYERYLTAFRGYGSLYDFDPPPALNDEDRIKAVNEYWLAYGNLFQIASDSVLLAVSEFHKVGWLEETDLIDDAFNQEFKSLYATMIMEMRKDAFEQTALKKNLVQERLPFVFLPSARAPTRAEQQENPRLTFRRRIGTWWKGRTIKARARTVIPHPNPPKPRVLTSAHPPARTNDGRPSFTPSILRYSPECVEKLFGNSE